MSRARTLDRRHRRALAIGIGASVAVHAALLGLRFEVPLFPEDPRSVSFLPAPELLPTPLEAAIPLIALPPNAWSSPSGPMSDAAPAAEASSSAAAPVAASSTANGAPAAASLAVAEPAFERLAVIDPLSNVAISPVSFTDLPAAAVDAAPGEDGADDVELYVPGSIGKAKRQWAGNDGLNTLGNGPGIRFVIGGGGGHCPMPGGRGPLWSNTT